MSDGADGGSADLRGRTCVVTGATSGLGRACAEQLAGLGARVELVARSPEKAERTRREIAEATGNPQVGVVLADLSRQAQVREAARTLQQRCERIDVLLNNAGVVELSRHTTADGIETTFAVNHLAPFLLTNLLLPAIERSQAGRIVTVASDAHRFGGALDLDDLELEQGYSWTRAYGRSKGANILFTVELARRLADAGSRTTANAVHPGFVRSGLGANNGGIGRAVVTLAGLFAMSPRRAARHVVALCASADYAGVSGRYFYKQREISPREWARDPRLARALWERSERYTQSDAG